MAFIIRDKTTNSTIRTIAYDIITTQQQQAGQMYGWLAQWRLHQTGSEPPMAWMGSGHHMGSPASTGSTMPGMATPAQLAQLRAATGPAADRLFLTLMIAHHRGGIGMARAIQPMTENPAVDYLGWRDRDLAGGGDHPDDPAARNAADLARARRCPCFCARSRVCARAAVRRPVRWSARRRSGRVVRLGSGRSQGAFPFIEARSPPRCAAASFADRH